MSLDRELRLMPIDKCFGDVRVRLMDPAEVTKLEDDVAGSDMMEYIDLVRRLQAELFSLRAKKMGLEIPQTRLPPDFDPTKFRGGSSGNA